MRWTVERPHLDRARRVVREHLARTPLARAPSLGEGVWLKLECEQNTGSFKVRGALAALAALPAEARRAGVVTASAGNHGYGLAKAGEIFSVPVTVFVAASTPAVKREGIAAAGASLEVVDARGYDAVEARAKDAARERGLAFVSPFDDPDVAAGNGGTVALEILEDLPDVATVVAPVGGGGLVAGLAAARRLEGARYAIVGVQSEACPAMVRSLALGRPLLEFEGAPTLAEGLEGGVSETTFEVARRELARMDVVSEAAIADAMRFAKRDLGLTVEGSAAVTIAWLRAHATEAAAPVVGVVSGGNMDPELLARLLAD